MSTSYLAAEITSDFFKHFFFHTASECKADNHILSQPLNPSYLELNTMEYTLAQTKPFISLFTSFMSPEQHSNVQQKMNEK